MKAVLEFDLPEEQEEYKTHMEGPSYSLVLYHLDNFLRNKFKYENEVKISIEELRMKITELCEEYECSIY